VLEHRKPAGGAAPATKPARKAPAAKTPAAKKTVAAKKVATQTAPSAAAPRKAAPRKTAARKTAEGVSAGVNVALATPQVADLFSAEPVATRAAATGTRAGSRSAASVQAVLACLPELAGGQSLALNVAVQRLREAQLLGKNSSSLKLFAQWSDQFELSPADQPTQVRLRR
jgi:hypothetical protein